MSARVILHDGVFLHRVLLRATTTGSALGLCGSGLLHLCLRRLLCRLCGSGLLRLCLRSLLHRLLCRHLVVLVLGCI